MKVIAHRGASGEYPENTLLAFKEAIKQQADGIELDIQYHQSNDFVLLHYYYLDKTTDGKGSINDYSLADLQKLNAGQNEFIPTLKQALKLIDGKCLVNIEIKSAETNNYALIKIFQLLKQVLNHAIAHYNFTWSQFVVSSFNHPLLAEIKTSLPKISTAALTASCPVDYAECALQLSANNLNPSIEIISQQLIDDAHQKGLQVWVYTVDREEDILKCYLYGVDAVFTNYPAQTKCYINQLSQDDNNVVKTVKK
ncbi:MAG: glycerophosphodiester phosphodiesterase [Colwellia sp.]|nr:glycerophosphodiester phosphodiesterase [Colwellia sp.]